VRSLREELVHYWRTTPKLLIFCCHLPRAIMFPFIFPLMLTLIIMAMGVAFAPMRIRYNEDANVDPLEYVESWFSSWAFEWFFYGCSWLGLDVPLRYALATLGDMDCARADRCVMVTALGVPREHFMAWSLEMSACFITGFLALDALARIHRVLASVF
jgi:hypothetical protein